MTAGKKSKRNMGNAEPLGSKEYKLDANVACNTAPASRRNYRLEEK